MDVILRPITLKDTANIVKWRNSDDVKKYLYNQDNISERQHISYFHNLVETKKVYQFIIVADGIECGTTFLKNIDYSIKRAEFGIFIGNSSFRGKGIGTIATSKTIEIAFNTLLLTSIFLTVFSNNVGAIRSYEKVGFKIMSTDKKHILDNGSYVNIVEMEIKKAANRRK